MAPRPLPVSLAEGTMLLIGLSGVIQSVLFGQRYPALSLAWVLPASVALLSLTVLVAVHQRRAFARPLAMALLGAAAIRAATTLASPGASSRLLELHPFGVIHLALLFGVISLCAWFGLSPQAERHFQH